MLLKFCLEILCSPSRVLARVRVREQAEEELKDLSAQMGAAVEECKIALEKTERYMANVRQKNGEEWDGLRTKSRHNPEQLRQRVSGAVFFVASFLFSQPLLFFSFLSLVLVTQTHGLVLLVGYCYSSPSPQRYVPCIFFFLIARRVEHFLASPTCV